MEGDGDDVEEMEDLWYIRRLDNGLFTLQTVDYILAWIAMEDDGASTTIDYLRIMLIYCLRHALIFKSSWIARTRLSKTL